MRDDPAVVKEFLERLGAPTQIETLTAEKARNVASLLHSSEVLQTRLVEVRQGNSSSTVVMEVDVEVGQQPKHDIRRREQLAVVFHARDDNWPEILALRPDFPRALPHLNIRPVGGPPSLCLSDQVYSDFKRSWTPAIFIQMVRGWLSRTARDELHRADQPLEPLLLDFYGHLIVPHSVLSVHREAPTILYGYLCTERIASSKVHPVYRLSESPISNDENPQIAAALFTMPPRHHGVIYHRPHNLTELATLLGSGCSVDLLDILRDRLIVWKDTPQLLDAHPLLLIRFPVTRTAGGDIEAHELWAFLLSKTVRELGSSIGIWEKHGAALGMLLSPDLTKRGEDVSVELLNPNPTLSRARAAELNRIQSPSALRMAAIGAGALGSQVVMNLTRAGHGPQIIIDEDVLLPHNLARHALTGEDLGTPKAAAVARVEALTVEEKEMPEVIITDVLAPGERAKDLTAKFGEVDVILDMSASVAVARHLAIDVAARARRLSLFLNPSGSDLILLAEDTARTKRLDEIEMQYYWAVATYDDLSLHLVHPGQIRYARSCRDLTNQISQAAVSIHAGIGSEIVRRILVEPDAAIAIWRLSEDDITLARITVAARPTRQFDVGPWRVILSADFIESVVKRRTDRLPNETGGVLIGDCDMERRRIYLVGSINAPPDSQEWPTHYIRGYQGLRKQVEDVGARSAGMLRYMGEWHSHPDNASCQPSYDDDQAYAWLTEHMRAEGYPAIMMIVCQDDTLCCVVEGQKTIAPDDQ